MPEVSLISGSASSGATSGAEVAVLMGANVADQVARDDFCEATLATSEPSTAETLVKLFDRPSFRVRAIADIAGVEVRGSLPLAPRSLPPCTDAPARARGALRPGLTQEPKPPAAAGAITALLPAPPSPLTPPTPLTPLPARGRVCTHARTHAHTHALSLPHTHTHTGLRSLKKRRCSWRGLCRWVGAREQHQGCNHAHRPA